MIANGKTNLRVDNSKNISTKAQKQDKIAVLEQLEDLRIPLYLEGHGLSLEALSTFRSV